MINFFAVVVFFKIQIHSFFSINLATELLLLLLLLDVVFSLLT